MLPSIGEATAGEAPEAMSGAHKPCAAVPYAGEQVQQEVDEVLTTKEGFGSEATIADKRQPKIVSLEDDVYICRELHTVIDEEQTYTAQTTEELERDEVAAKEKATEEFKFEGWELQRTFNYLEIRAAGFKLHHHIQRWGM